MAPPPAHPAGDPDETHQSRGESRPPPGEAQLLYGIQRQVGADRTDTEAHQQGVHRQLLDPPAELRATAGGPPPARRLPGRDRRRIAGGAGHVPAHQPQPGHPEGRAGAQRRAPARRLGHPGQHEPGQERAELDTRLLDARHHPVLTGPDGAGRQLVRGRVPERHRDPEHRRPGDQTGVTAAESGHHPHRQRSADKGDHQRPPAAEAVDHRPGQGRQRPADDVRHRRQRPERRAGDPEVVGDERPQRPERVGQERADRHPRREGDDEADFGAPDWQAGHASGGAT